MSYTKEELVSYRVDRAEEALQEAKLLVGEGFWNSAANRLYYCCFYIVLALFAKHNLKASTHAGVKVQLHKLFIKTGKLEPRLGQLYSDLFNKRQESDYQDFKRFHQADIAPLVPEVLSFMESIKKMI